MRIRSSLTDESLYTQARREAASPRRGYATGGLNRKNSGGRLLRLIVLLVLVLLLMQQAADPQIYRNFFTALGVPLEPAPAWTPVTQAPPEGVAPATSGAEDTLQDDRPSAAGRPGTAGLSDGTIAAPPSPIDLTETVAELEAPLRESLAGWLSQLRRDPSSTPGPGEALRSALASAAVETGQVDSQRLNGALANPASYPELIDGLQVAVDQAHLQTASDATIWTPGDRLAFYRLLEAGSRDGFGSFGDQFTRVGYVTLTDQSASYLGRPVYLEGRAARVEFFEAEANPFAVEDYWLVWIQPGDGSQRPVMAYARSVSSGLEKLRGQPMVENGPQVRAAGVFLRRHLYRSARGSELAPVIVGRLEILESPSGPAAGPDEDGGSTDEAGQWVLVLASAAALGVLVTVVIAWRTAANGRWQRRMRTRAMPGRLDDSWQSLAANDENHETGENRTASGELAGGGDGVLRHPSDDRSGESDS